MKQTLAARVEDTAQQRAAADLQRRRRVLDYAPPPWAVADGRRLINFCGNDYLGLSDHPVLTEALAAGARAHGAGAGASPLVTGYRRAHRELEARLADFTGFEAALLMPSGYQANLALGAGICGRREPVAVDRLNHASINDALRLAGARIRRYAHADYQAASEKLQAGARLLATDTVFSMDGDLAPLPALVKGCERHDTALWVDDAHGFGVLGDNGLGALEHFGIAPEKVDAYVATFGKALGTGGAFIAGDRSLIEHLVNTSRPVIYSTAPPPALAAATGVALELLRKESWRRERLRDNVGRFRRRATELGLPLTESETPIQPLILGDNTRAVAASRHLEAAGFLVTAIRPPTVPAGTARLRITLSAAHEADHIDDLSEALAEWA